MKNKIRIITVVVFLLLCSLSITLWWFYFTGVCTSPWNIVWNILSSIGTIVSLFVWFIRSITKPLVDKYLGKYDLGFYDTTLDKEHKLSNLFNVRPKYLPCSIFEDDGEYIVKVFIGNTTDKPDEIIEGYFKLDNIPYSEISRYVFKCWLKEIFNCCDYPFLCLHEYCKNEQFESKNIKEVEMGRILSYSTEIEKANKLYPTTIMLYRDYLRFGRLETKLRLDEYNKVIM